MHEDRHLGGRDLTRWESPLGRRLVALVHRISLALGSHQTLLLVLAVGAAVAATTTWLASETYEAVAAADGVAVLDQPLLDLALGLRSPWLDAAATAYTDVGGVVGMPVLATTTMVALAVRRRSWTPVILITAAAAGSLLMTVAGKDLVGRARPPLADAVPPFEHSPSFPSGHSLNALVVAGVVAYLLVLRQRTRRARVLTVTAAALFALTIGLSRVFLGHHWFTDVLAAWILGVGWLAVVVTAHRLYLTTRRRAVTAAEDPETG
ncbi:phosphatase PAP2 family protein [Auraticoccus sp. F435]|uniref:Phosphatase PAP2 family protein n=1 Tax=Auraticoccus cholistanensis TaxID=2656650 RepID=A0A6A9V213_9ACTN|nr:phosphatase PAP2 family protein [Auraticoccus cholistanensis]